ncbi:ABC1 atypical kinase-like domain [Dillenia turbinata]|uniref:ABC1 atypical kinase-like domain n=1 Tax=Dillenia turbinata TaxID=194707 RepID=A0AAN8WGT1_9MAGN
MPSVVVKLYSVFHSGAFVSKSGNLVANDFFGRRIAKLCNLIVLAVGCHPPLENKYLAAFEDRQNFIHADMHPGNILVRVGHGKASQKLLFKSRPHDVFVDVGMTTEISQKDRLTLLEFFKAVTLRDGQTAAQGTIQLSKRQNCPNPEAFIKKGLPSVMPVFLRKLGTIDLCGVLVIVLYLRTCWTYGQAVGFRSWNQSHATAIYSLAAKCTFFCVQCSHRLVVFESSALSSTTFSGHDFTTFSQICWSKEEELKFATDMIDTTISNCLTRHNRRFLEAMQLLFCLNPSHDKGKFKMMQSQFFWSMSRKHVNIVSSSSSIVLSSSSFCLKMHEGALVISAKVLKINPECYTTWKCKKLAVQRLSHSESNPKKMHERKAIVKFIDSGYLTNLDRSTLSKISSLGHGIIVNGFLLGHSLVDYEIWLLQNFQTADPQNFQTRHDGLVHGRVEYLVICVGEVHWFPPLCIIVIVWKLGIPLYNSSAALVCFLSFPEELNALFFVRKKGLPSVMPVFLRKLGTIELCGALVIVLYLRTCWTYGQAVGFRSLNQSHATAIYSLAAKCTFFCVQCSHRLVVFESSALSSTTFSGHDFTTFSQICWSKEEELKFATYMIDTTISNCLTRHNRRFLEAMQLLFCLNPSHDKGKFKMMQSQFFWSMSRKHVNIVSSSSSIVLSSSSFCLKMHEGALVISAKVLKINPECYTTWKCKKLAVQRLSHSESNPKKMHERKAIVKFIDSGYLTNLDRSTLSKISSLGHGIIVNGFLLGHSLVDYEIWLLQNFQTADPQNFQTRHDGLVHGRVEYLVICVGEVHWFPPLCIIVIVWKLGIPLYNSSAALVCFLSFPEELNALFFVRKKGLPSVMPVFLRKLGTIELCGALVIVLYLRTCWTYGQAVGFRSLNQSHATAIYSLAAKCTFFCVQCSHRLVVFESSALSSTTFSGHDFTTFSQICWSKEEELKFATYMIDTTISNCLTRHNRRFLEAMQLLFCLNPSHDKGKFKMMQSQFFWSMSRKHVNIVSSSSSIVLSSSSFCLKMHEGALVISAKVLKINPECYTTWKCKKLAVQRLSHSESNPKKMHERKAIVKFIDSGYLTNLDRSTLSKISSLGHGIIVNGFLLGHSLVDYEIWLLQNFQTADPQNFQTRHDGLVHGRVEYLVICVGEVHWFPPLCIIVIVWKLGIPLYNSSAALVCFLSFPEELNALFFVRKKGLPSVMPVFLRKLGTIELCGALVIVLYLRTCWTYGQAVGFRSLNQSHATAIYSLAAKCTFFCVQCSHRLVVFESSALSSTTFSGHDFTTFSQICWSKEEELKFATYMIDTTISNCLTRHNRRFLEAMQLLFCLNPSHDKGKFKMMQSQFFWSMSRKHVNIVSSSSSIVLSSSSFCLKMHEGALVISAKVLKINPECYTTWKCKKLAVQRLSHSESNPKKMHERKAIVKFIDSGYLTNLDRSTLSKISSLGHGIIVNGFLLGHSLVDYEIWLLQNFQTADPQNFQTRHVGLVHGRVEYLVICVGEVHWFPPLCIIVIVWKLGIPLYNSSAALVCFLSFPEELNALFFVRKKGLPSVMPVFLRKLGTIDLCGALVTVLYLRTCWTYGQAVGFRSLNQSHATAIYSLAAKCTFFCVQCSHRLVVFESSALSSTTFSGHDFTTFSQICWSKEEELKFATYMIDTTISNCLTRHNRRFLEAMQLLFCLNPSHAKGKFKMMQSQFFWSMSRKHVNIVSSSSSIVLSSSSFCLKMHEGALVISAKVLKINPECYTTWKCKKLAVQRLSHSESNPKKMHERKAIVKFIDSGYLTNLDRSTLSKISSLGHGIIVNGFLLGHSLVDYEIWLLQNFQTADPQNFQTRHVGLVHGRVEYLVICVGEVHWFPPLCIIVIVWKLGIPLYNSSAALVCFLSFPEELNALFFVRKKGLPSVMPVFLRKLGTIELCGALVIVLYLRTCWTYGQAVGFRSLNQSHATAIYSLAAKCTFFCVQCSHRLVVFESSALSSTTFSGHDFTTFSQICWSKEEELKFATYMIDTTISNCLTRHNRRFLEAMQLLFCLNPSHDKGKFKMMQSQFFWSMSRKHVNIVSSSSSIVLSSSSFCLKMHEGALVISAKLLKINPECYTTWKCKKLAVQRLSHSESNPKKMHERKAIVKFIDSGYLTNLDRSTLSKISSLGHGIIVNGFLLGHSLVDYEIWLLQNFQTADPQNFQTRHVGLVHGRVEYLVICVGEVHWFPPLCIIVIVWKLGIPLYNSSAALVCFLSFPEELNALFFVRKKGLPSVMPVFLRKLGTIDLCGALVIVLYLRTCWTYGQAVGFRSLNQSHATAIYSLAAKCTFFCVQCSHRLVVFESSALSSTTFSGHDFTTFSQICWSKEEELKFATYMIDTTISNCLTRHNRRFLEAMQLLFCLNPSHDKGKFKMMQSQFFWSMSRKHVNIVSSSSSIVLSSSSFCLKMHEGALVISAKLLKINPECYTTWKCKKLAVQHLSHSESNPKKMHERKAIVKFIDSGYLTNLDRSTLSKISSLGHGIIVNGFLLGHSLVDYEIWLLQNFQTADPQNFQTRHVGLVHGRVEYLVICVGEVHWFPPLCIIVIVWKLGIPLYNSSAALVCFLSFPEELNALFFVRKKGLPSVMPVFLRKLGTIDLCGALVIVLYLRTCWTYGQAVGFRSLNQSHATAIYSLAAKCTFFCVQCSHRLVVFESSALSSTTFSGHDFTTFSQICWSKEEELKFATYMIDTTISNCLTRHNRRFLEAMQLLFCLNPSHDKGKFKMMQSQFFWSMSRKHVNIVSSSSSIVLSSSSFCLKMHEGALVISAKLLKINPECYTTWKCKKLAVQHLSHSESNPKKMHERKAIVKFIDSGYLTNLDRSTLSKISSLGHGIIVNGFLLGHSLVDYEIWLLQNFQTADPQNFQTRHVGLVHGRVEYLVICVGEVHWFPPLCIIVIVWKLGIPLYNSSAALVCFLSFPEELNALFFVRKKGLPSVMPVFLRKLGTIDLCGALVIVLYLRTCWTYGQAVGFRSLNQSHATAIYSLAAKCTFFCVQCSHRLVVFESSALSSTTFSGHDFTTFSQICWSKEEELKFATYMIDTTISNCLTRHNRRFLEAMQLLFCLNPSHDKGKFKMMQSQCTEGALVISAKLLKINPECYTTWKCKKLAVQHLSHSESNPKKMHERKAIVKFIDSGYLTNLDRSTLSKISSLGHGIIVNGFLLGHSLVDYEIWLLQNFQTADPQNFQTRHVGLDAVGSWKSGVFSYLCWRSSLVSTSLYHCHVVWKLGIPLYNSSAALVCFLSFPEELNALCALGQS